MDPLLRISDLQVFRGQRHVLRGVNLKIGYGEIIGLIGRNGSGKSTLISTITGQTQVRDGWMRLAGEPYQPESLEAAASAGVSVVAQDFSFPEGLTVARAIFRGSFLRDADEATVLERARELIARRGFAIDPTRDVATLNAAEAAQVEVIRVSAEEAHLVVLDEVSVLLNDAEVAQLHATMRQLRTEGRSIIYVGHRLEEVRAVSDRIVVLREGVVVGDFTARDTKVDELVFAMLDRETSVTGRQVALDDPKRHITVSDLNVPDALRGVWLDLHMGEAFGIVGLRHSGAHELALAIGGLINSSIAAMTIGTERYESIDAASHRIGYLGGFRHEDEREQISTLLTRSQGDDSELLRMQAAAQRARDFGLTVSNINDPATSLSGGDRQKVALSTLENSAADLVVLDHPSRGVDIGAMDVTDEALRSLLNAGKTVIVISNDLGEVLRLSHRIGVLHEGRLVAVLDNHATNEDEIMSYAEGGSAEWGASQRQGRRSRGTA